MAVRINHLGMEQQRSRWVWHLFFFSSRRRHTRLQGDWSSDVCSSDLAVGAVVDEVPQHVGVERQALGRQEGGGVGREVELEQPGRARDDAAEARGLADRKSVV